MTSVPRLDTTSRFAKLIVLGDSETKKRDLLISYSNPGYPDGPYSLSHEFGTCPLIEQDQQESFILTLCKNIE